LMITGKKQRFKSAGGYKPSAGVSYWAMIS
jgi:hypothetical protein